GPACPLLFLPFLLPPSPHMSHHEAEDQQVLRDVVAMARSAAVLTLLPSRPSLHCVPPLSLSLHEAEDQQLLRDVVAMMREAEDQQLLRDVVAMMREAEDQQVLRDVVAMMREAEDQQVLRDVVAMMRSAVVAEAGSGSEAEDQQVLRDVVAMMRSAAVAEAGGGEAEDQQVLRDVVAMMRSAAVAEAGGGEAEDQQVLRDVVAMMRSAAVAEAGGGEAEDQQVLRDVVAMMRGPAGAEGRGGNDAISSGGGGRQPILRRALCPLLSLISLPFALITAVRQRTSRGPAGVEGRGGNDAISSGGGGRQPILRRALCPLLSLISLPFALITAVRQRTSRGPAGVEGRGGNDAISSGGGGRQPILRRALCPLLSLISLPFALITAVRQRTSRGPAGAEGRGGNDAISSGGGGRQPILRRALCPLLSLISLPFALITAVRQRTSSEPEDQQVLRDVVAMMREAEDQQVLRDVVAMMRSAAVEEAGSLHWSKGFWAFFRTHSVLHRAKTCVQPCLPSKPLLEDDM
ncbi:unnamed protein product, partial [Closterium sp. NIES-65]